MAGSEAASAPTHSRLVSVEFTASGGHGHTGKILVNGEALPGVRRVVMTADVNEAIRVDLEMIAPGVSSFTAEANVNVALVAYPGYVVIAEESQLDGCTRFHVEPAPRLWTWLDRLKAWMQLSRSRGKLDATFFSNTNRRYEPK